jgi:hypothetical protein
MMNEFLEALNDEVMEYFADIGIYPGIKPEKIRGGWEGLERRTKSRFESLYSKSVNDIVFAAID